MVSHVLPNVTLLFVYTVHLYFRVSTSTSAIIWCVIWCYFGNLSLSTTTGETEKKTSCAGFLCSFFCLIMQWITVCWKLMIIIGDDTFTYTTHTQKKFYSWKWKHNEKFIRWLLSPVAKWFRQFSMTKCFERVS